MRNTTTMRTLLATVAATAVLGASNIMADTTTSSSTTTASTANSSSASSAIGVIDINVIFTESKAAQEVNKQMNALRTKYETEAKKQATKLQEQEKTLAAQQGKLSPADFEKKKQDFDTQVGNLQRDIMEKNSNLQRAANEATEKVRTAVIKVSGEIANEKGYSIILPSTTSVFFQAQTDITSEVMKRLDKTLPTVKVEIAKATKSTSVKTAAATNKKVTKASS